MPGAGDLLSVAAGLGLAAASGFRVFLPLLAAGAASRLGYLPLAGGFEWLASTPALVALGVATLLEILAYYIPWVDNALDTIATPAAVAAGVLASMSVLTDFPPALRWAIGIIGGGSAAGLVQGLTALLRLKSTAATGGIANPIVATIELLGAGVVAVLAILLPLVALIGVVALLVYAFRATGRLLFGRRRSPPPPGPA
jgi:hypothetical protein